MTLLAALLLAAAGIALPAQAWVGPDPGHPGGQSLFAYTQTSASDSPTIVTDPLGRNRLSQFDGEGIGSFAVGTTYDVHPALVRGTGGPRRVETTSLRGPAGCRPPPARSQFGRTKSVTDNTGTTTYTLDVLDRPTQIVPSGGRKTATLSYHPNLYGTKAWVTRTSLAGISGYWETEEDTKGRPFIERNPLSQTFTTEHFADGQPEVRWFPNGTRQEYGAARPCIERLDQSASAV